MTEGIADCLPGPVRACRAGRSSWATRRSRPAPPLKDVLPRIVVAAIAVNASLCLAGLAISTADSLSQAAPRPGRRPGPGRRRAPPARPRVAGRRRHLRGPGRRGRRRARHRAARHLRRPRSPWSSCSSSPPRSALVCHALPQTEGLAQLWWRAFAGLLAVQVAQSLVLVTAVRVFLATGGPADLGIASTGGLVDLLVSACLCWVLVKIPGLGEPGRVLRLPPGRGGHPGRARRRSSTRASRPARGGGGAVSPGARGPRRPARVRIPADVERPDRLLAGLTARQLAILAVRGGGPVGRLRGHPPRWSPPPSSWSPPSRSARWPLFLALGRFEGAPADRVAGRGLAPVGAPPPAWCPPPTASRHLRPSWPAAPGRCPHPLRLPLRAVGGRRGRRPRRRRPGPAGPGQLGHLLAAHRGRTRGAGGRLRPLAQLVDRARPAAGAGRAGRPGAHGRRPPRRRPGAPPPGPGGGGPRPRPVPGRTGPGPRPCCAARCWSCCGNRPRPAPPSAWPAGPRRPPPLWPAPA